MARVGVLLAAYGGPRNLDEVAQFMASIMGVDPSEAALADAHRRYLTIGGFSPLPFTAERVAVQLERALNGVALAVDDDDEGMGMMGVPKPLPRAGDVKMPVVLGMLHSAPCIADAVAQLAELDVREIVLLPLSPFDSESTGKAYRAAVDAAVAAHPGLRVIEAARYNTAEKFTEVLADNLAVALQSEYVADVAPLVVFTAHSLPTAEIAADPCYVDQLRETAAAVAERLDLGAADGFTALPGFADAFGGHSGFAPWLLAFQSKGRRGGEWIGPDLDEVISAAIAEHYGAVVVSPIGFAVDHMETLFDLDVAAAGRVLDEGAEFSRATAPNDAPVFIEALADAVRKVI